MIGNPDAHLVSSHKHPFSPDFDHSSENTSLRLRKEMYKIHPPAPQSKTEIQSKKPLVQQAALRLAKEIRSSFQQLCRPRTQSNFPSSGSWRNERVDGGRTFTQSVLVLALRPVFEIPCALEAQPSSDLVQRRGEILAMRREGVHSLLARRAQRSRACDLRIRLVGSDCFDDMADGVALSVVVNRRPLLTRRAQLLRELQRETCIRELQLFVDIGCLADEGFDAPTRLEAGFFELDWIEVSDTPMHASESVGQLTKGSAAEILEVGVFLERRNRRAVVDDQASREDVEELAMLEEKGRNNQIEHFRRIKPYSSSALSERSQHGRRNIARQMTSELVFYGQVRQADQVIGVESPPMPLVTYEV